MATDVGRPRRFDENEVLERAMQVFWRQGFQAASLGKLTEAMGINKPSLYAAFGDKASLYLRALERYVQRISVHNEVLNNEPDTREAVRRYLLGMADVFTDPSLPSGCFIVNGSADLGDPDTPEEVRCALSDALTGAQLLLRQRLEQAKQQGELAEGVDAESLAALYATLLGGLAVQATGGARKDGLRMVIEAAMAGWPGISKPT